MTKEGHLRRQAHAKVEDSLTVISATGPETVLSLCGLGYIFNSFFVSSDPVFLFGSFL